MANATIYGRTSSGEYIAVQVDANGVVQSSATVGTVNVGDVAVTGGTLGLLQGGTIETKRYTAPASGAFAVGTAAGGTQLPNVACALARFKAQYSNGGTIYLGGPGVTVPGGTTDTTSGIPLAPGDDTGWIPVSNANKFYAIAAGTASMLTYLAMN